MKKEIHHSSEQHTLNESVQNLQDGSNSLAMFEKNLLWHTNSYEFDFRDHSMLKAIQSSERESPEDLFDETLFYPSNELRMKQCM
jgi:hypothetical protein